MTILEIQDKLVSIDLFKKEFVCNLSACKGACCVEGDSGAPLLDSEVQILKEEFEVIQPFLRPEGAQSIKKQGTSVVDMDDEHVTPLREGKECAYTVFDDDGTAKCGIENAWLAGKTTFQKPVSCHLYPIRVKRYDTFTALNYDRWTICSDACALGEELSIPIYAFVKDALVRAYGESFYADLEEANLDLNKMEHPDEKTK